MAIKDQCCNCKAFDKGTCQATNSIPHYNQTSCTQYSKRGIRLYKETINDYKVSSITPQPIDDTDIKNTASGKQSMFRHPFSFKGRIRRLEYGLSYLLCYIISLPLDIMSESDINGGVLAFYLLIIILANWFILAQGAKRCHDRDNSGWYQIIPLYGLWMLFGDGDEYENNYGPDPKGRDLFS